MRAEVKREAGPEPTGPCRPQEETGAFYVWGEAGE